jgi:hypothetical protein
MAAFNRTPGQEYAIINTNDLEDFAMVRDQVIFVHSCKSELSYRATVLHLILPSFNEVGLLKSLRHRKLINPSVH